MGLELAVTTPSSGHSAVGTVSGLLGTAAVSLRTIAPAFFLYGTSALVHAEPHGIYVPRDETIKYATGLSSGTTSAMDVFKRTSVEKLVVSKLDSIFEELLAAQQDLDQADHKAIASKLWELYR